MASMCFLFSKYSPNILVNENHGRLFIFQYYVLISSFFFGIFSHCISHDRENRRGRSGANHVF